VHSTDEMTIALRSLHVDIEGGWGGSSRSLFQLLSRLDRSRVEPLIAHRQSGPIEGWYAQLGIPTVRVPEIGSFVPRRRKSGRIFAASLPRLLRLGRTVDRLKVIAHQHGAQIVHLNYEGLFLLARPLKAVTGLPIVCHNRALLPDNAWGRWLVRRLSDSVDYQFFISPQEEARVRVLEGQKSVAGSIVWNIAPEPSGRLPFADPPEAVYLGNLDASKGTDRMIDIAAALEAISAPPLRLAVYGEARQARPQYVDDMSRRIMQANLGHRIVLRGYTTEPESVLAKALALIRPSREDDPWGRDVIEASVSGVPVLATGRYEGVVEDGVTGFLYDPFDPEKIARQLVELVVDQALWSRLSVAAGEKGRRQFSGVEQVASVTDVFEKLALRGE
jgi:glycosyltransferase involved in cell wall biosynthesis